MARFAYPVTMLYDGTARTIDFMPLLLNSGQHGYLLLNLFGKGNHTLLSVSSVLPKDIWDGTQDAGKIFEKLSFPFLEQETREFHERMGADESDLSGDAARRYMSIMQFALSDLQVAQGRLNRARARYHLLVAAKEVTSAPCTYDPRLGEYRMEPEWDGEHGSLFVCAADPVTWGGFQASALEDLNVELLADHINDQLSEFVEDGSIDQVTAFDELERHIRDWHEKRGIPLDWENRDDAEDYAHIDPSADKDLQAFIADWNEKQNVIAYMLDESRVIINPDFTKEEVAERMRKQIRDLERKAEKKMHWDYRDEKVQLRPDPGAAYAMG